MNRDGTSRRQAPEIVPTLNAFIRSTLQKGESGGYQEGLDALASLTAPETDKAVHVERALARLLQHGHITPASVPALLGALKTAQQYKDKGLVRLVYFLVQLALGDGSAGAPLPMPFSKGNSVLPKAVDRYGPEVLSASWQQLSDDKSPFMNKQGAMRALAALAHASLTSKPDDAMYVGGVFVTIQSLLDSLDAIQAKRNTLEGIAAQHAAASKKKGLKDYRARMEVCALMRIAFSAARVSVSRSGISKIAARSFAGACSADPVGARHALALASLAAKDNSTVGAFVSEISKPLKMNLQLSRTTGRLFGGAPAAAVAAAAVAGLGGAAPAPPAVIRDAPEGALNLKDPWARVYLARGLAAAVQSGVIAGDLTNRGAAFWEALQMLALADPNPMVSLEAIRAMFGAPYPKYEPLGRRRGAGAWGPEADEAVQARVFGASWHMMMSVADAEPTIPKASYGEPTPATLPINQGPLFPAVATAIANATGGPAPAAAGGQPPLTSMTSYGAAGGGGAAARAGLGSAPRPLFVCIVDCILNALKSGQRSLIGAACRTVAVIAESRAWCMSLSGGLTAESEAVQRQLSKLAGVLQNVLADNALGACERAAAVDALLWLQEYPKNSSSSSGSAPSAHTQLVQGGQLLKCMAQGGSSVPPVVRVLFADPWPEGLVSSFMCSLLRCLRCSGTGAADALTELALAAAAAAPARMPREALIALLDAVPGTAGVKAAAELLSSPLPPVAQPNNNSPVEVKLLAAQEETAYEGLRGAAAWWLGEHVNQIAGSFAWKPVGKQPVTLPLPPGELPPSDPSERLALAAAALSPLMAATISQLQRSLLSGSWELRTVAAQSLAKVAVRSREPFRLQCYSALASTQLLGAPGPLGGALAGSGCAGPEDVDALGLAVVVRPLLEILDAMYAGEVLLRTKSETLGRAASGWPKQALASLKRRHEYLLYAVQQRIGFVPKDAFYPLGPLSKRLLKPDEPLDEEEEEEEREYKAAHVPKGLPKNILEAATAAAAAAVAAEQEKVQQQALEAQAQEQQGYYGEDGVWYAWDPASQQYVATQYYDDQQYSYDQAYYEQQYYGQQWYYDEDGNVQYYDGYYGEDGQWYANDAAAADPLASWQADANNNASAFRVSVHIPGEGEGEAYYTPDTPADDEDFRWGTAQFAFDAQGDDEVSVSAGERVKVLVDMGDWLHVVSASGARGLVPASYVAVEAALQQGRQQGGAYGAEPSPTGGYGAGGGGYGGYDGGAYGQQYGAGAGTYGAEQYGTYGGASAAAAGGTDDAYGTGGGGYGQQQYSQQQYGDGTAAAGADAGAVYGSGRRTYEEDEGYYTAPQTDHSSTATAPARETSSYEQPTTKVTSQPTTYAPSQPATSSAAEGAASQQPQAHNASVVWDFNAENDDELSVKAGDQVVVGELVDEWYSAMRVSDGMTGLVPAAYVQLL